CGLVSSGCRLGCNWLLIKCGHGKEEDDSIARNAKAIFSVQKILNPRAISVFGGFRPEREECSQRRQGFVRKTRLYGLGSSRAYIGKHEVLMGIEKARFWDDRWLDGESLKMRFSRVYALELCKDITVASKVTQHSLVCSLRRRPREGVEQQQFEELLTQINGVHLVPMGDRWTWKLSSSGEFSVASVRRLIDDKTLPDAAQKTRWVRYVPIKVNVIAWKVKSNSLPTRFNISRRGIPLDSIKCGICDTRVETVSHLFFSCDLVRQLVLLIARWWDVSYVGVESYADWVSWMENLRLSFKNKLMLEGVFYVLWWSMPNSPLRITDKIKLSRSDSCIANLSLETSYTTLQEIMK
nr:hypothetical protein [Tanacetum cinerariifolium]